MLFRSQLGAAEYRLVHHAKNGRGVYSFCMCPGGTVVAAASEPGRVVTNGMSQYSRNERNANAGIVVGITPEDYPGGVLAGIVGGRLLQRCVGEKPAANGAVQGAPSTVARTGLLETFTALRGKGAKVLLHLALLLACMKAGAFLSAFLQARGLTFPVYMGALLVAAIVRNVHDAFGGGRLRTECTDAIGAVALAWLLAVVMINLQLAQLAQAAMPLLVILVAQTVLTTALAGWVVFRLMGRDHEAAVMTAGLVGFGLGATSDALASMRELTGSRPAEGSSKNRISGSRAMARASPARFFMPPDNSEG